MNKNSIINLKELVEFLKTGYPNLDVQVVSWHGMSLQNQIKTVANSNIFISLPGSDLMNALFLRPHSTILTPCRKVQVVETSNEVTRKFLISIHFFQLVF